MTSSTALNQEPTPLSVESPKPDRLSYSIDIVDLNKTFQRRTLGQGSYTTLKSAFIQLLFGRRSKQHNVTRAVNDLTLRIPQGAAVGIIGRNGSGKSTLLKLITGIYRPTSGSIQVNGRVAALIELGAGFHPDFTGRENLYLGGIMHGLTRKEIDERFDEIVEFAELTEVIDDPVRTYSSGMFMRLGFSLAVHTDPDVLLIDEVLAVGDAVFVGKCHERISQLKREGKTLLLVTHDLSAVERWCDEVLWLESGEVQERGDPRRVIDAYRQFVERGEEAELRREQLESEEESLREAQSEESIEPTPEEISRWGSREVEITQVRLLNKKGEQHLLFHADDSMRVEIDYTVHERVSAVEAGDIVFGIGLHRSDGITVHGTNTQIERVTIPALESSGTISYVIDRLGLLSGNYSLDVAVHRQNGYPFDYRKGIVTFAVRWPFDQVGVIVPAHRWEIGSSKDTVKGWQGRN